MFELISTNPMSPVTEWLDTQFRAKLGSSYRLSQEVYDRSLPDTELPDAALLRLYASRGMATNLSMAPVVPALARAKYLQLRGVKILNAPEAHFICDDKLLTAKTLLIANVPTPLTWDAHWPHGEIAPAEYGWIIKPRWGELGRGIELYATLADAQAAVRERATEPMVLQHYLPEARCVRVVASRVHAYAAYEKWMPDGGLVAAVSLGGVRRDLDVNDYGVGELAVQAIEAVGADYAGVDVLISGDEVSVLEVNISPGGLDAIPAGEELVQDIVDNASYYFMGGRGHKGDDDAV